jgi:CDP-diacylglycerol--glycerol-3-phosphate 3-phosphatidyltransferase
VRFNPANVITAGRIALAPMLGGLAWQGREHWFLAGLMVSLASDIADGQVARRFNLASELGSRLDSWADLLTYTVVPLAIWWLRPALVATEKVVFFTAVASYALPLAIGFIKFRRLTSYHTLAARIAAYLMGAAVIILFAQGSTVPLRIAVCVLVLAELEEIGITLVLREPRSNVRTLGQALQLRREAAKAGPATH